MRKRYGTEWSWQWWKLSGYIGHNIGWVRWGMPGYGIAWTRNAPTFHERYCYKRVLPLPFGWRLELLKK